MNMTIFVPIVGALGVLYALYLFYYIKKQPDGNQTMQDIAELIQKGASAFLKREYSTLVIFIVTMFVIIWAVIGVQTAFAFASGAICSMLAGFIGMTAATRANVRTAQAATQGQNKALVISFTGGSVMGLTVASIGLLGLGLFYLLYKDPTIISGFGMGASSIALFARVGGGIYTKSADVGADLVGKVEVGIPEDDPRNPAVIADNVGDNVGDVAGMGADLFESYVGSVIATIAVGSTLNVPNKENWMLLPLIVIMFGTIASFLASLSIRIFQNIDPQKA
ncbi:H(+)-translocating pyrophosphatase, partial [Candidatus Kryptonium thompsonii]